MSTFSKHTKESLSPLIAESFSYAEALRNLGLRDTGGNRANLRKNIQTYGIDTSHFLGQGHRKGKASNNKKHWEKILVVRHPTSSRLDTRILRRAMIEYGFIYKCSDDDCGITLWKGKAITLEVDHINGDHLDNRPENVRFMCPNCHTQEPTSSHSWKNAEGYGVASKCDCGNWKTSSADTCKDCYNLRRGRGKVDTLEECMV